MSSHTRLTRWQKATALVPLALLSGAWTTSLTLTSSSRAPSHPARRAGSPTAPASPTRRSRPRPASRARVSIAPGVPTGSAHAGRRQRHRQRHPGGRALGLPAGRPVIDSADKGCHIDWTADRGDRPRRVQPRPVRRQHPRPPGVSRPGHLRHPAGRLAPHLEDQRHRRRPVRPRHPYDRAVGPMQFIPSTWSVIGVDGDNDGKRNPQDIDDAALATAVYLCSATRTCRARPASAPRSTATTTATTTWPWSSRSPGLRRR